MIYIELQGGRTMNIEVILQLTVLAFIVITGPLVIGLLALRKGNL